MGLDELVISDDGPHMPIAECSDRSFHGDCHPAASDEDLSGLDCIDARSVRRRDVDTEMEALGVAVAIAGVVEVGADGMLSIEGLDRPSVRRPNSVTVSDSSSLRERGA
jgi:hypothetical protein